MGSRARTRERTHTNRRARGARPSGTCAAAGARARVPQSATRAPVVNGGARARVRGGRVHGGGGGDDD
eukprot:2229055-Prymnesium_polylepis.2